MAACVILEDTAVTGNASRFADAAVFFSPPPSTWTAAIRSETERWERQANREREREGAGGGATETEPRGRLSSTQGHAECSGRRVTEGAVDVVEALVATGSALLPIIAARVPNCLIGGCVWDGGGSRARVFLLWSWWIERLFVTQRVSQPHHRISLPHQERRWHNSSPLHPAHPRPLPSFLSH